MRTEFQSGKRTVACSGGCAMSHTYFAKKLIFVMYILTQQKISLIPKTEVLAWFQYPKGTLE
jgi:hypothetical protein